MSSGIFAIIGVALGSVLTYAMQSLLARRTEVFTRAERLRSERLAVYSAFAAGSMEGRRTQIARWYQRGEVGRGGTQYPEAKEQSYQSRAAARLERYRVELVSPGTNMTALAEETVKCLGTIHKAESEEEMEKRAEQTKSLIEQFIVAGADDLARGASQKALLRSFSVAERRG